MAIQAVRLPLYKVGTGVSGHWKWKLEAGKTGGECYQETTWMNTDLRRAPVPNPLPTRGERGTNFFARPGSMNRPLRNGVTGGRTAGAIIRHECGGQWSNDGACRGLHMLGYR